jgi:phenylacetic acid degradation operon negative regulatory protein
VAPSAETRPRDAADLPSGDRLFGPVSTSQRLLFTLLGDYWWGYAEHIPSAALVALLGEFGVSEAGSRAALSRVSRSGVLEGARDGRTTSYRLSAAARRSGRAYARWVARSSGVGAEGAAAPWDGRWTCVTYTVPEEERDTRRAVRGRLRALGFGPLHDGVWVSPRGGEQAARALSQLGVERYTVLTGAEVALGSGVDPTSAWDLDGLRQTYVDLVAHLTVEASRLRRRRTRPATALVTRTELMSSWRSLAQHDPGLPAELLPPDWPGVEARRLVVQVYDGLGPLAEERVREIVAPFSAAVAAAARCHPFAALA